MIEIDVDGKSYAVELVIFELYERCGCNVDETVKAYLDTSLWSDAGTLRGKKRAFRVVKRAVEIGKQMQSYEVILTGGGWLCIPLAKVTSVKPFPHIAKKVFRRFNKTLGRLELPGYFIEDRQGIGKPVRLEMLLERGRK